MRLAIAAVAAFTLAGCGAAGPPKEAKETAAVLTGDAKGAASDNPVCKLFTVSEVSGYAGNALKAGENAAMGTGCQWATDGGEAMVMVQAVPTKYADDPSLAPGYKKLPDIGEKGYVAKDMGGWVAGAIGTKDFVKISVVGPKASEASATALLKEALKRHG